MLKKTYYVLISLIFDKFISKSAAAIKDDFGKALAAISNEYTWPFLLRIDFATFGQWKLCKVCLELRFTPFTKFLLWCIRKNMVWQEESLQGMLLKWWIWNVYANQFYPKYILSCLVTCWALVLHHCVHCRTTMNAGCHQNANAKQSTFQSKASTSKAPTLFGQTCTYEVWRRRISLCCKLEKEAYILYLLVPHEFRFQRRFRGLDKHVFVSHLQLICWIRQVRDCSKCCQVKSSQRLLPRGEHKILSASAGHQLGWIDLQGNQSVQDGGE